jgi:hypothetical protein
MYTTGTEWYAPSEEYTQEQVYRSWMLANDTEQGGFDAYGSNMTHDDHDEHEVGYEGDLYQ